MPIWNDISDVALEDRVNFQGKYNAEVLFCPECSNQTLGVKNTIGFSSDMGGWVVEIQECPKCFEIFYHHTSPDMYTLWKIMKDERTYN